MIEQEKNPKERVVVTTVEKVISGGEGLARVEGRIVFIPGVLPGEEVRVLLKEKRGDWLRAELIELLEASPERREPFCPHYKYCGGCSWQHMSYPAQLEAKKAIVREALVRQGSFEENSLPDFSILGSAERAYRARIRPSVRAEGSVGFRHRSSKKVVLIDNCPVATTGVNRFFHKPPLGLAVGSEPVIFGDEQGRYWVEGQDREAEVLIRGRSFCFPPGSFFQSNITMLPAVIDAVLADCGTDHNARVFDLFSGVGLFAAFLADHFESVIGVDSDAKVAPFWKRNVGARGKIIISSVERWLSRVKGDKPSWILVNPPRQGLGKDFLSVLAGLNAPHLTYVSCHPVTQARDLKHLCQAGYGLEKVELFDLYPQTPHVEIVAQLRR